MLPVEAGRLDQLAEQARLWYEFGDASAFTPEDALELIEELRAERGRREHTVAMLTYARAQAVKLRDAYREAELAMLAAERAEAEAAERDRRGHP
jgi:hypothetical protein